jgi:hypothetical protein
MKSPLPSGTRMRLDTMVRRGDETADFFIEFQEWAESPAIRGSYAFAMALGYRGTIHEFVRDCKLYVARDYTPMLSPRSKPEPGPRSEP